MDVVDAAGAPAPRGDPSRFRGEVWMSPLLPEGAPGGIEVASVLFAPGAHTAWHVHPAGQVLHVLSGVGVVQSRGGRPARLRAGDTVRAAPGEEHWHGATPEQPLTHLAVQPGGTEWHEHVDETEYRSATSATSAAPPR